MILQVFHLVGSAGILFIINYVLVDFKEKKSLTVKDIISRVVLLTLLFLVLSRT